MPKDYNALYSEKRDRFDDFFGRMATLLAEDYIFPGSTVAVIQLARELNQLMIATIGSESIGEDDKTGIYNVILQNHDEPIAISNPQKAKAFRASIAILDIYEDPERCAVQNAARNDARLTTNLLSKMTNCYQESEARAARYDSDYDAAATASDKAEIKRVYKEQKEASEAADYDALSALTNENTNHEEITRQLIDLSQEQVIYYRELLRIYSTIPSDAVATEVERYTRNLEAAGGRNSAIFRAIEQLPETAGEQTRQSLARFRSSAALAESTPTGGTTREEKIRALIDYILAHPTECGPLSLNGINLSGVNLSGVNLSGVDLTDANLTDVDLTNTVLTNATVTNVTLSAIKATFDSREKFDTLRQLFPNHKNFSRATFDFDSNYFRENDLKGLTLASGTSAAKFKKFVDLSRLNLEDTNFTFTAPVTAPVDSSPDDETDDFDVVSDEAAKAEINQKCSFEAGYRDKIRWETTKRTINITPNHDQLPPIETQMSIGGNGVLDTMPLAKEEMDQKITTPFAKKIDHESGGLSPDNISTLITHSFRRHHLTEEVANTPEGVPLLRELRDGGENGATYLYSQAVNKSKILTISQTFGEDAAEREYRNFEEGLTDAITFAHTHREQGVSLSCIQFPICIQKYGRQHFVCGQIYLDDGKICTRIVDSTNNPIGYPEKALLDVVEKNKENISVLLGGRNFPLKRDVETIQTNTQPKLFDKKCPLHVLAALHTTASAHLEQGPNVISNHNDMKTLITTTQKMVHDDSSVGAMDYFLRRGFPQDIIDELSKLRNRDDRYVADVMRRARPQGDQNAVADQIVMPSTNSAFTIVQKAIDNYLAKHNAGLSWRKMLFDDGIKMMLNAKERLNAASGKPEHEKFNLAMKIAEEILLSAVKKNEFQPNERARFLQDEIKNAGPLMVTITSKLENDEPPAVQDNTSAVGPQ